MNSPARKWLTDNDAETIFDRLEAHGKTWKVYVSEPMQLSATGLIHYQRLKDRLATHFVPFAQFEIDAANGALPDFSLIEPCLTIGHNDYHPAYGRALAPGMTIPSADPPSSVLGGRNSWPASTTPTGACSPKPGPMCGTPRCSSAGTNRAVPTITCHPPASRHPTRPAQLANAGSGSTVPATGCRPSSSPPG